MHRFDRLRLLGFVLSLCALFFAAPAAAQSLALEISEARLGSDQRTAVPILQIVTTDGTKGALARFSQDNIGRKIEVRVAGEAILPSSVVREPLLGGSIQISGPSEEQIRTAVERLSKPSLKIELVIVP